MFTGIVALAGAAGVGLAVWAWSLVASKRKREDVFGSREPLTAEEVFSRYYAESGLPRETVVHLWNECASKLRVPAEKLRPTDRFEQELAAADFWASLDDPREDLTQYAMAFAKKHGAALDLKAVKTLDDLIRQLAGIERHPA